MTLTALEHREARAFIEDEMLAEKEPRRRRLLSLVQSALSEPAARPERVGGYQPIPIAGPVKPPPRNP